MAKCWAAEWRGAARRPRAAAPAAPRSWSMRTTEQDQPAADPDEDEIEQTEGHERSSWPTADPWRIAAAHRPGRLLVPHRLASPADTDPYAAVDILDPRLDDGVVIDGELAECHIACAGHRFVPLDDLPVDQRFVGLMRMPETDWRDPQTIRNMAAGWTEAQACKWIEGLDGLMTSVENGCCPWGILRPARGRQRLPVADRVQITSNRGFGCLKPARGELSLAVRRSQRLRRVQRCAMAWNGSCGAARAH